MKYSCSMKNIMHKFCVLLFTDFVFFLIHTLFITMCVCFFLALSVSLSLYISFVCSSLTDRLHFSFFCPILLALYYLQTFSRLLKQWARAFVPCAILFSSLRNEDDIAASFTGVFFLCHFLFFFDIHINTYKSIKKESI